MVTDRPTDRRTDKAGYRVACTRLKIVMILFLLIFMVYFQGRVDKGLSDKDNISMVHFPGRVGEGLSDEDNIPLRISLLLFDEIFDLGSNQWLRRRIVAFLRQIIKATFGDTINKKIMDYMESYITPTQVREWVIPTLQILGVLIIVSYIVGIPSQPIWEAREI